MPMDRGGLSTEARNLRSMHLHTLDARACVELIAREDERVAAAVRAAGPEIARFVEAAERGFQRGGRLIYVGAGTSGRLGVLDASEAPPTFQVEHGRIVGLIAGGDQALRRSSEGMEDDREGAAGELESLSLTQDDAVLGIASGGTTPYVLGALGIAKRLASTCVTGLLTCARVERPPDCDRLIVIDTGPEVLTGSTRMKAGTATKMTLNSISTTLMVRSGRVYENLMVDLRATNDKLRDRAARIVAELTGLSRAESFSLLDACGGEVKTAVASHRLGVNADAARTRLAQAGGRLDAALEERKGSAW